MTINFVFLSVYKNNLTKSLFFLIQKKFLYHSKTYLKMEKNKERGE